MRLYPNIYDFLSKLNTSVYDEYDDSDDYFLDKHVENFFDLVKDFDKKTDRKKMMDAIRKESYIPNFISEDIIEICLSRLIDPAFEAVRKDRKYKNAYDETRKGYGYVDEKNFKYEESEDEENSENDKEEESEESDDEDININYDVCVDMFPVADGFYALPMKDSGSLLLQEVKDEYVGIIEYIIRGVLLPDSLRKLDKEELKFCENRGLKVEEDISIDVTEFDY